MPGKSSSPFRIQLAVVLMVIAISMLAGTTLAEAQQEAVLHSFDPKLDPKGAWGPMTSLVRDSAGNLYGTTEFGGPFNCHFFGGCGTVYEVVPQPDGSWGEKVLHSFGSGTDGFLPQGPLLLDASGNLYGTTTLGGEDCACGTVFELMPQASGKWTEKILYNSDDNSEGPGPGLNFDSRGNLYGTAFNNAGQAVLFELSPQTGGAWTYQALYTFSYSEAPNGYMIFDSKGNLYGETELGGTNGTGGVYELTPQTGGTWNFQVLYSFRGYGTPDGVAPFGNLVMDGGGNLYGTTYQGGPSNMGLVFELSPQPNGKWVEKILHGFLGMDGEEPYAGLAIDASSNLYGTTVLGGVYDWGTAFELTPAGNGEWNFAMLHNFGDSLQDAEEPRAALILDPSGNLYGTTYLGGAAGRGTVFEIAQ
ncbi:MAG: choice-of-anchor tandem repeat GloVer-containing protein [Candidatus Sulfotelmatobacter sp.]